jgi:acyl-coenzyme A synthetase/AMP-(fatty) acid ligase
MVLDEQLRPVAPGVIGDLYIRGVGVSPGYWRDLEKTRSVFFPWGEGAHTHDRVYKTGDLARRGADGLFYYVGRADTQIKSRGYRIELGEIEAALHSLPGLRESAVVAIKSEGFEGWLICCAYVPASSHDVSPESLRKGLAGLVPGYMLPARWTRYEVLPKNESGKIDRPRLKDGFRSAESRPVEAQAEAPSPADVSGMDRRVSAAQVRT